ncbi:MAG: guanylate kinase [Verrucomicrobia bacterium]|nr:guanylate kinase [Verrucomicrobiota bacterium]
MIKDTKQPLLLVVSAPSGAGKTTLCDRLIREFDNVVYSVSCTTRAPREGEVHGKSYFFLSDAEFDDRKAAGEFIEFAKVHDNWYGTLKQTLLDALSAGKDVLMDIDVQGAGLIRNYLAHCDEGDPLKQSYVDAFIAPPSIQDLQLRLWGRGKDEKDVIERRLQRAEAEMEHWHEYQYLIVNDRIDESYDILRAVFVSEHHRIR